MPKIARQIFYWAAAFGWASGALMYFADPDKYASGFGEVMVIGALIGMALMAAEDALST